MAMRKNGTSRPKAESKKDLKAQYAKYRREFTAADLQRYTETDQGVPADKVLSQMKSIHRQETRKRKKA